MPVRSDITCMEPVPLETPLPKLPGFVGLSSRAMNCLSYSDIVLYQQLLPVESLHYRLMRLRNCGTATAKEIYKWVDRLDSEGWYEGPAPVSHDAGYRCTCHISLEPDGLTSNWVALTKDVVLPFPPFPGLAIYFDGLAEEVFKVNDVDYFVETGVIRLYWSSSGPFLTTLKDEIETLEAQGWKREVRPE